MQKLVDGHTFPIKTKLYEKIGDAPRAALSIAGRTFDVLLTGRDQVTKRQADLAGSTLTVATEGSDTVATFTPGARSVLAAGNGPYRFRVEVEESGKYFSVPDDDDGEVWHVYQK